MVAARDRFATERLAGTFSGIAALTGSDADELLLLRPWFAPFTGDWKEIDGCAALIGTLDKVSTTRVPEAGPLRDWFAGFPHNVSDVPEFEAGIDSILQSSGRPWSRRRGASARLGWHHMETLLARGALDLPAHILPAALRGVEYFRELAQAEAALDVVVCHGDPDPDHFRVDGAGDVVLIDGEKLHLAFPGRDIAEVITAAAATRPDSAGDFFQEALVRFAPGEELRRTVLAWAGLHVLEGIARGYALDRHASVRTYTRVWTAVQRTAGFPDHLIP